MDRNIKLDVSYNIQETSLSARRAWIEIILDYFSAVMRQVALRKESVDRNVFGFGAKLVHSCRSPQGERG